MDQIAKELTVITTCANDEEASSIARALVESRLAACAQLIRGVESVYRWQGLIETSRETLLLVKTTSDRFEALRDRILELHSYDVPEIVAMPITAGSKSYLDWLREQVKPVPD